MQRIRAGERTVCFDSSKYLVEEPEYLWDSGAIAFGWPLVLLIPGASGLNITNTRDDAVNIVVKWLVVAGLCMIAFRA